MFEISVFTSNVVKIHLVKSSYQVFSGAGADSPVGHSGRCPRYWLPGEKKRLVLHA